MSDFSKESLNAQSKSRQTGWLTPHAFNAFLHSFISAGKDHLVAGKYAEIETPDFARHTFGNCIARQQLLNATFWAIQIGTLRTATEARERRGGHICVIMVIVPRRCWKTSPISDLKNVRGLWQLERAGTSLGRWILSAMYNESAKRRFDGSETFSWIKKSCFSRQKS